MLIQFDCHRLITILSGLHILNHIGVADKISYKKFVLGHLALGSELDSGS